MWIMQHWFSSLKKKAIMDRVLVFFFHILVPEDNFFFQKILNGLPSRTILVTSLHTFSIQKDLSIKSYTNWYTDSIYYTDTISKAASF